MGALLKALRMQSFDFLYLANKPLYELPIQGYVQRDKGMNSLAL